MKISDTLFSFSRFSALCRKEMVESWKVNGLRALMIYIGMTVLFLWRGYFAYKHGNVSTTRIVSGFEGDSVWEFSYYIFAWGLFTLGLVSASLMFEGMRTKTGRTSKLMLPATSLEKYLVRWIMFTLFFVGIYLIAFKLADWTRVWVYSAVYPELSEGIQVTPIWKILNLMFMNVSGGDAAWWVLIGSFYFFLQSFYVLGSSIWTKYSGVKTTAVLTLIFLVYLFVGVQFAELIIPSGFFIQKEPCTAQQAGWIAAAVFSFFALFNWTLAYYRFKESEIIQRW